MIEYVDYTIEPNNTSKDIKIKYRDIKLTKGQYNYLKDKLNYYMFTTDDEEYPMIPILKYDEFYQSLTINLIISAPFKLISDNSNELNRILETHINKFQEFYEKQKEDFNLLNHEKD
ncbi:hypothetical protein [Methanobacterium sp.]|uniref:hypothetical protein n=1 Tax=Methanobacterium sp. TaxID=2164 RepID=UPI003C7335F9